MAEADLYPTIFINGTLGYEADLGKLFESQSFMGNITPNFRWDILNYGRIINNVHVQQAHTQELIANYQNQVLTAAQQVQTALRRLPATREQAEDLARSVSAGCGSHRGWRRAVPGRNDTLQYGLQSGNRTGSATAGLAVAQGNIALNLIAVYRAMGGGWEIRYDKENNSEAAKTEVGTPHPGVCCSARWLRIILAEQVSHGP